MNNTIRNILAYSGLLPFLALVIAAYSVDQKLLHTLCFIFIAYSAIILSFLAGANWGRNIEHEQKTCVLVITNIIALLAWAGICLQHLVSFSYNSILIALSINTIGFLVIFLEEKYLFNDSNAYLQLRLNLSITVIVLHIVLILKILF